MKTDNLPLGEFASNLLVSALKSGAEQAEVYLKSSGNLSLEVKNQEIDAVESSLSFGYSLRVIKDGRLGFSYSTSKDESGSVIKNALEAARWADKDEFLGLPLVQAQATEPRGLEIFDKESCDIKEGAVVKRVLKIEKAARDFDKRIKKARKVLGTFGKGEIFILNSKGINASYPFTKFTAQVMTIAEENNESQMGWDFNGSRFLNDISFEDVGKNAAKRAVQLLGAKRINTIKAPIILDNSVASEFLGIFASSFSAESAQKGRSLLRGKTGQHVISGKINIIDSGIIPRMLGTRPFDDEGIVTSEKILIKEGALQGFLHNAYTAKKDGVNSTGNAMRGGYTGLPSVGISNLYLKVVSETDIIPFNKLTASLDQGLYITEALGVHTANPITGEFSIGVSGLWIENGEIQFPVKEAVISGDVLGLFQKIEAAGDDMRFYGNIGTPSLLIGPTDISA